MLLQLLKLDRRILDGLDEQTTSYLSAFAGSKEAPVVDFPDELSDPQWSLDGNVFDARPQGYRVWACGMSFALLIRCNDPLLKVFSRLVRPFFGCNALQHSESPHVTFHVQAHA